ncbi:Protein of unknown function [Terriglobus roseus]|uniref:DUF5060 domain-containing protein n=2 Tax=Terriglobus roseus TaxID=392734 RepID=A0A1G7QSW3_9BACT|nr:Protein of unknown function [Terriglobus roseus]
MSLSISSRSTRRGMTPFHTSIYDAKCMMTRREWLKIAGMSAGAAAFPQTGSARDDKAATAEQWDCFELTLHGPSDENPFVDITFGAQFRLGSRTVSVPGFYDGEGLYRVRFMPDQPGAWTWKTESNASALNGHAGTLRVMSAAKDNHGPVSVAHRFHFAHADGTPFFPFGTTCYSMGFMGEPWETQTLDALRTAGFNNVRLCLMPKGQGSRPEPALPFVRTSADGIKPEEFDFTRFNPAYFRHFEQRILDLLRMGIEADVILFHPYDGWGFRNMTAEADDRYLRYAVARLSAYRNVWWAIANEYDLVKTKQMSDWDRYFRVVSEADPSNHLRSIHHSKVVYDHSKPWCTHASLQEYDFERSEERRRAWGKPIVYDEIQYEGNIARRWGNLSAEEMARRFWLATVRGTYASHGETFITPPNEPVWSDGGKLRGHSAPRIAFLRKLVESLPTTGLNEFVDAYYLSAGAPGELYLYYFDTHALAEYDFPLPAGVTFLATLIDPFAMTMQELPGTFTGKTKSSGNVTDENAGQSASGGTNHIQLPGKPGMAIVFRKV